MATYAHTQKMMANEIANILSMTNNQHRKLSNNRLTQSTNKLNHI